MAQRKNIMFSLSIPDLKTRFFGNAQAFKEPHMDTAAMKRTKLMRGFSTVKSIVCTMGLAASALLISGIVLEGKTIECPAGYIPVTFGLDGIIPTGPRPGCVKKVTDMTYPR
jgi:hypothetical protein